MHGGLPGRSAQGAAWSLAFFNEVARAQGEHCSAVSVDVYKAFDQLSRPLIAAVAMRAGAPCPVVRAWYAFTRGLRVTN
eukprot:12272655-Alexandrium_andersonii.AAC.1